MACQNPPVAPHHIANNLRITKKATLCKRTVEHLGQLFFRDGRCLSFFVHSVQSFTVGPGHSVHILWTFHPPLNLQRVNACLCHFIKPVFSVQVLHTEQIAFLNQTVIRISQLIFFTAGLGTKPPVTTSAANRATHQALA